MPSLLRPPLVLILLCLFLPLSSPRLLPESNPLPIPAHAWDFRSCDPAVTVHSPYPGQVQAQFSAQITCDSAGATLAGDESPYIELDEFLFGGSFSLEIFVRNEDLTRQLATLLFFGYAADSELGSAYDLSLSAKPDPTAPTNRPVVAVAVSQEMPTGDIVMSHVIPTAYAAAARFSGAFDHIILTVSTDNPEGGTTGNVTLYKNGMKNGFVLAPAPERLQRAIHRIGGGVGVTGVLPANPFMGTVGWLKIWTDLALTDAQVLQNYNKLAEGTGCDCEQEQPQEEEQSLPYLATVTFPGTLHLLLPTLPTSGSPLMFAFAGGIESAVQAAVDGDPAVSVVTIADQSVDAADADYFGGARRLQGSAYAVEVLFEIAYFFGCELQNCTAAGGWIIGEVAELETALTNDLNVAADLAAWPTTLNEHIAGNAEEIGVISSVDGIYDGVALGTNDGVPPLVMYLGAVEMEVTYVTYVTEEAEEYSSKPSPAPTPAKTSSPTNSPSVTPTPPQCTISLPSLTPHPPETPLFLSPTLNLTTCPPPYTYTVANATHILYTVTSATPTATLPPYTLPPYAASLTLQSPSAFASTDTTPLLTPPTLTHPTTSHHTIPPASPYTIIVTPHNPSFRTTAGTYVWSTGSTTTTPTLVLPVSYYPPSTHTITVTYIPSPPNGNYTITLTVTQAATPVPAIVMIPPPNPTAVNPAAKTILLATVTAASPPTTHYTIFPSTPYTLPPPITHPSATATHNLIIPPNTLTPGVTYTIRFTVTLSAVSTVASTTITVNTPPSGGSITGPSTGVALSTLFSFTATGFTDRPTDYPLTYQFYYIDLLSNVVRLGSSAQDVMLPPGEVTVGVECTDVYGANTNRTRTVTVAEPAEKAAAVDMVSALAAEMVSNGDVEGALAMVNTGVGVLDGVVQCDAVPDCAALGRAACGGYTAMFGGENLCGDCENPDSVGLPGPSDQQCLTQSDCSDGVLNGDETDVDCGGSCNPCASLFTCVHASDCESSSCVDDTCTATQKTCQSTTPGVPCSSHGACVFHDYNKVEVATCATTDTACTATCVCATNFGGAACHLTASELTAQAALRSSLLKTVASVAATDSSPISIAAQATAISSVTSTPTELDANATKLALALIEDVVSAAGSQEGVSAAQMNTVIKSAAATISNLMDSAAEDFAASIDGVATLTLSTLTPGEEPSTLVTKNLAMTSSLPAIDAVATATFKSPVANSTTLKFPDGLGATPVGVVVSLFTSAPHPTAAPTDSSVVRLTLADSQVDWRRFRKLTNRDFRVKLTTTTQTAIGSPATLITTINCTANVQEVQTVMCDDEAVKVFCDGSPNPYSKQISCTPALFTPVCGLYDAAANEWVTDKCVSTGAGKELECDCMIDGTTINPEFAAMLDTVASSIFTTVLYGVNNLFDPDTVLENPTIFVTMASLCLLALSLCYRGHQMDIKEGRVDRQRVLDEYEQRDRAVVVQQEKDEKDAEDRAKTIQRLLHSANPKDRARGAKMKHAFKKVEMMGTDGTFATKQLWTKIKDAGGGTDKMFKNEHSNFLGINKIKNRDGDSDDEEGGAVLRNALESNSAQAMAQKTLTSQIEESVPKFIKLKHDKLTLFARALSQFHSLFSIATRKYNGSGQDRPVKVAFVFVNILNLMFATAATYELRAGSEVDTCSQFHTTTLEACTAEPSPFDPNLSRCVFEWNSETCNVRPIGGDTWKITGFLAAVTAVLTIPMNMIIRQVFFKGILPPSMRAVKEANKVYLDRLRKDGKEVNVTVMSWEEQCMRYNDRVAERMADADAAIMSDLNPTLSAWQRRVVPRAMKVKWLETRKIELEARQETKYAMEVLLDRRWEMSEGCRHDETGQVVRLKEAYRLDLLLIGQGADKKHLSVERGGERTPGMDAMRTKFCLHEFDELFGLGKFAIIYSKLEEQKTAMRNVWERMLYLRCNCVLHEGAALDVDNEGTLNHLKMKVTKWRREKELGFWTTYLKGDKEKAAIYVDLEEDVHKVYVMVLNDLWQKLELEKNMESLPERQRGIRLMEWYNMLGLNKVDALVYKLNVVPITSLPLATQEFTKYLYWLFVLSWTAFCVFYLLAFGAKHGDDVVKLWLAAFFFGWAQKAVVNEPQIIFLKHVVLPIFLVQSLEKSMATASRWHLLHHVWVHGVEINNRELKVGGVHRIAVEKLDEFDSEDKNLLVCKYIVQHVEVPVALRNDRNEGVGAEEVYMSDKEVSEVEVGMHRLSRCDRYFRMLSMAEGSKKIRMILDGAVIGEKNKGGVNAAKEIENGLSWGVEGLAGIMGKFEKGMNVKGRSRLAGEEWVLAVIGVPLLAGLVLCVLDQVGLGEAGLAVSQVAVLWLGGDWKWFILECLCAPVVLGLLGGLLGYVGLLKALRKGNVGKWWGKKVGRLEVVVRVRNRDHEVVDGVKVFVEGKWKAVLMWLWEESLPMWIWRWGKGVAKGVREEGAWKALVMKGVLVRGAKRVMMSWNDWRLGRKWDVLVVQEGESGVTGRARKRRKWNEGDGEWEEGGEEEMTSSVVVKNDVVEQMVGDVAESIAGIVAGKVAGELLKEAMDEAVGDVMEALAEYLEPAEPTAEELKSYALEKKRAATKALLADRTAGSLMLIVMDKVVEGVMAELGGIAAQEVVEALKEVLDGHHEEDMKELKGLTEWKGGNKSPKGEGRKRPKGMGIDELMKDFEKTQTHLHVPSHEGEKDWGMGSEEEEHDDHVLLGGRDEEAVLVEAALRYKVPDKYTKHSLKINGPGVYLAKDDKWKDVKGPKTKV